MYTCTHVYCSNIHVCMVNGFFCICLLLPSSVTVPEPHPSLHFPCLFSHKCCLCWLLLQQFWQLSATVESRSSADIFRRASLCQQQWRRWECSAHALLCSGSPQQRTLYKLWGEYRKVSYPSFFHIHNTHLHTIVSTFSFFYYLMQIRSQYCCRYTCFFSCLWSGSV